MHSTLLVFSAASGLLGLFLFACSANTSTNDVGPAPESGDGSTTSPGDGSTKPLGDVCFGSGSIVYTTLKGEADGGTTAAVFADCLDAGGIPPLATEGACAAQTSLGVDPLTLRPFIDPGTVRVTAPTSGIDVSLSAATPIAHVPNELVAPGSATFLIEGTPTIHKAEIAVTIPVTGALAALATSASRSSDLELSWTGASDGTVVVQIAAEGAAPGSPVITCSTPGSDGHVTVAASLLGHLPAGAARVQAETMILSGGIAIATVRQELAGAATLTLE